MTNTMRRADGAARLVKGADSIELKLTLPEHSYRSAAAALGVDPLEAQIRQVFFFDTPDLDLNSAGVVARARRVQGRDARLGRQAAPGGPGRAPGRAAPAARVRRRGRRAAGRLRLLGVDEGRPLSPNAVHECVAGDRPLRKLFSKAQRAFFAEHAPDGLTIDDLSVLGPIFVLKLKMAPETFSRRLVAEMWLYPDGSRIVELSTKCAPGRRARRRHRGPRLPREQGHRLEGEQQTKTKTALEFFSAELRDQAKASAPA